MLEQIRSTKHLGLVNNSEVGQLQSIFCYELYIAIDRSRWRHWQLPMYFNLIIKYPYLPPVSDTGKWVGFSTVLHRRFRILNSLLKFHIKI